MAISKEEAALYGYITGKTVPKGTTRKVFGTLVSGVIGAGRALVPPLARGTGRTALGFGRGLAGLTLPGKIGLGALTLYEAQQMGLLDAPIERAKDETARLLFEAGDFLPQQTPEQFIESMQRDQGIKRPKKVSKYNKSVKIGMAAARGSKYFGKKGTISKPQAAFKTVNSVASKLFAKKKVPNTGSKGVIARAIRKMI